MRDKGRFNKDLTVVYQQPLSSTNVVVPVELIARREEPESSMVVLEVFLSGATDFSESRVIVSRDNTVFRESRSLMQH